MKNLITAFIVSLSLFSCGGSDTSLESVIASGNLEEIRAKKKEITTQQKQINEQIKTLDSVISKLGNVEKLPLVNTITISQEVFKHFLELQGDVSTKQNVLIYPEMAGTLQRVYVKEGDRVKKGQLLASIDDGGMGSQLNQLKTQAALAKTTFERQERLWNQQIGSEIQYLQAKTQFEAAQDAVSQIQSQLGKSNIRAPFSGIIDDVIKDQGTVVSPGPGSEVFRLVNLSDMFIEVEVPETYLGAITKGKETQVYFPVLGDSLITNVRETGNFINPSNRSFSAEIPVPNKQGLIKPNLTAKVRINDYTNESAILIPSGIISENAEGQQYIYTTDSASNEAEGIAKRVIITTGKTQLGMVEILNGLSNGDHVIKEGARSVKDGQKVKIKN